MLHGAVYFERGMVVADCDVISFPERRMAPERERQVTSDEGWRLIRAFRQIRDHKRREEIIALVERSVPASPHWPNAG